MNGKLSPSFECTYIVYIYRIYRSDQSNAITVPQRQPVTTKEQRYDKSPIELFAENLTNIRTELDYRVVQFSNPLWSFRLDLDDGVDLCPPNTRQFLFHAFRSGASNISNYPPAFRLLRPRASSHLLHGNQVTSKR